MNLCFASDDKHRALLLLLTFFYLFFFLPFFFFWSFFKTSCSVYSLESVLSEALVDREGLQRGWLTLWINQRYRSRSRSRSTCLADAPRVGHIHHRLSRLPPAQQLPTAFGPPGGQGSSNTEKDRTCGCFPPSSFGPSHR